MAAHPIVAWCPYIAVGLSIPPIQQLTASPPALPVSLLVNCSLSVAAATGGHGRAQVPREEEEAGGEEGWRGGEREHGDGEEGRGGGGQGARWCGAAWGGGKGVWEAPGAPTTL